LDPIGLGLPSRAFGDRAEAFGNEYITSSLKIGEITAMVVAWFPVSCVITGETQVAKTTRIKIDLCTIMMTPVLSGFANRLKKPRHIRAYRHGFGELGRHSTGSPMSAQPTWTDMRRPKSQLLRISVLQ
jgi:hypothetical protein